MKQALHRLDHPDCISGIPSTRNSQFGQLSILTDHTNKKLQLKQQRASTHKSDAGNGSWAHKIAIRNLPYMDNSSECITGRRSGQQLFRRIFRLEHLSLALQVLRNKRFIISQKRDRIQIGPSPTSTVRPSITWFRARPAAQANHSG